MNCSYNAGSAGSTEIGVFCVFLPGVEDVTDGSVDYYPMDWELSDAVISEREIEGGCSAGEYCPPSECPDDCGSDGNSGCAANAPEQTDQQDYEIVTE